MNTCYDLMGTYRAALFVCAAIMLMLTFATQLAIGMARAQRRAIESALEAENNA